MGITISKKPEEDYDKPLLIDKNNVYLLTPSSIFHVKLDSDNDLEILKSYLVFRAGKLTPYIIAADRVIRPPNINEDLYQELLSIVD